MKLYNMDEIIKYKNIFIIRALLEFHNNTSLIPRNVTNHILVFPFTCEYRMGLQRSDRRRTTPINDNDRHGKGNLDLHVAVRRGDLSGAREIVARDKGAVSRTDSQGNIPLHLAVVKRHKEMVRFLVKEYPQGCYVLNHEKKCPIYLAVDADCVEFASCMLEACVNDANCVGVLMKAQPIVHLAITNQNLEMVKTLLEYRPELIQSKDDQGWTPLSHAAFKGHLNIVHRLLDTFPKSISDRNSDQDRSWPVHKACLGGQVEVLRVFHSISSKSLFREDQNGRNIVHIAAKERDNRLKDVVSYLVGLAVNSSTCRKALSKEDGFRFKPLDLAQRNGNHEIVQLLSGVGTR